MSVEPIGEYVDNLNECFGYVKLCNDKDRNYVMNTAKTAMSATQTNNQESTCAIIKR